MKHIVRLVFFLAMIASTANAGCGEPRQSPESSTVFSATARLRGVSESCIELSQFVGRTIRIEILRGAKASASIDYLYRINRHTDNIYTVARGSKILVSGPERDEFAVRISILEPATTAPPVDHAKVVSSWTFRGGQGFGPAQASLQADGQDVLVLNCDGALVAKRALSNIHAQPVMTLESGERQNLLTFEPAAPAPAGFVAGKWTMPNFESPIWMDYEQRFVASDRFAFGTALIDKHLFRQAYTMLKESCTSGIAYGAAAAMECRSANAGYREGQKAICSDTALKSLHKEISMLYGAASSSLEGDDLLQLWTDYASRLMKLEACASDQNCHQREMTLTKQALEKRLSAPAAASLGQALSMERSPSLPLESQWSAELKRQGVPTSKIEGARLLQDGSDKAYILAGDVAVNSISSVFVLHKLNGASAKSIVIDPNKLDDFGVIARKAAPLVVREKRIETHGRYVGGGGFIEAHHLIFGLPVIHPSGRFRSVTTASYTSLGEEDPQGNVAANTRNSGRGNPGNADALFQQDAAEQARASQAEAERIASENSRMAKEKSAAETAMLTGYIYKNNEFWSQFLNPGSMRSVFDGGQASDRIVLGWAVAFDRHCHSLLPRRVTVFRDITQEEWSNLLGQKFYSAPEIMTLTVDSRLASSVMRARQSKADVGLSLEALGIGTGGMPDFGEIVDEAKRISQPSQDAESLISGNGCTGPITNQFSRNLLASLGHGATVQEAPLLSPSQARSLSDPPR